MRIRSFLGLMMLVSAALSVQGQTGWQQKVNEELPLMGHRNWIVIVDSAYPLQSSPGVETVKTSSDQLAVLDYVLGAIRASKHVRPLVHTDAELQYVPMSEAPGVEQYREQLKSRLAGIPADSILHQELIDRLNGLGKDFHVLILKTNMTIPYTSVFLQLDCKYWGADSEERLRSQMKAARLTGESKP
jgi:RbsD / FucU transport protein family